MISISKTVLTTNKIKLTKESNNFKSLKNFGFIDTVGAGIAQVKGLFNVRAGELVRVYPYNILALALNLGTDRVGLVLCGSERFVNQNDIVSITGKLISIAVNPKVLGTVIDPLGFNLMTNQILSGSNTVSAPVEFGAPDIISRQPIFEPLLTGLTVIDSLVPIGRGQRELIIGDRQTGKHLSQLMLFLNQTNVICVYVSIGQKCSGVAQIFKTLKTNNKTKNLVIVCGNSSRCGSFTVPCSLFGLCCSRVF